MDRLPTLRGDRCTLRWLTPADAPALYAIFGDDEVCRYWSRPALKDLSEAEELQREIADLFAQNTLFQWGIALAQSDEVIGTATLTSFDLAAGRAEVGFALARAAWGHGFAHEALTALIAFAFDTLNLKSLDADVDPANERSARVLERLGFRFQGMERGRYVVAGVPQEGAQYLLRREEWLERL